MMLRLTWLILVASLATACATTVRLGTKPAGARVTAGGNDLGTTPVQFSVGDITDRNANGVTVRLSKEGYRDIYMWIPDVSRVLDVSINLAPLFRDARRTSGIDDHDISRLELNRLTESMLDMQTKLLLGQDIDSEQVLRVLGANPTLASAHFLQALVLLKSGDQAGAQAELREALRFAPEQPDFLSLFNEVKPDQDAG